jgi:hemoglobin
VHAFYAKIRRHPVLGPIFLKVIGEDWGPHLVRMCDFWSSVTMMSGRYKGTPMAVHQRIAGLERGHFQLWLALWRETAQECCSPEVAAIFIDRAERIARSLQLALFYRPEDDAPVRAQ